MQQQYSTLFYSDPLPPHNQAAYASSATNTLVSYITQPTGLLQRRVCRSPQYLQSVLDTTVRLTYLVMNISGVNPGENLGVSP